MAATAATWSSLPGARWVTGWQLWGMRGAPLAWFLIFDVAAVAATVLGLVFYPPSGHDLEILGALLLLGIGQAEASRNIERVRRRINTVRHVNLTSVWSFAGVLLLPPGTAYLVVWLLYLHLGLRSWLGVRAPYRQFFSASAVVVTSPLTLWLYHLFTATPFAQITASSSWLIVGTAVAAFVYSIVDMLIMAVSVGLITGRANFRIYVMDFTNHGLDIATNCLGAFVALALVYQPLFVLLLMVPVLVIHRSVLVKELEDKVIRDQKTGLLNASAWNEYANRELARAERSRATFGVLMVDLDHFKMVNDTYGHPAGDDVLVAVADVLRNETRQYDSAGRFGGEEFAVLLPDTRPDEVGIVAERIRARIGALTVHTANDAGPLVITEQTASIGVAIYPAQGLTLDLLVKAADGALYEAKRSGRDRVVGLSTVPGPNDQKRAS